MTPCFLITSTRVRYSNIILLIFPRFYNRLSDCFIQQNVYRNQCLPFQKLHSVLHDPEYLFYKTSPAYCDLFYRSRLFSLELLKLSRNNHIISCILQLYHCVTSNKTCSTCLLKLHDLSPPDVCFSALFRGHCISFFFFHNIFQNIPQILLKLLRFYYYQNICEDFIYPILPELLHSCVCAIWPFHIFMQYISFFFCDFGPFLYILLTLSGINDIIT